MNLAMSIDKYFDDDDNPNEWMEHIAQYAAWELFQNQEKWLYMYGELGEKRWPMLKYDALHYIEDAVKHQLGWLISHIVFELVKNYVNSDIDLSDTVADEYNEWFGYEPGDKGYVDGKVDPEDKEPY